MCLTIISSDTVGFISKLPTTLIAAFRSTLSEVLAADVLVHVIDRSNPVWRKQRLTVMRELYAVGCLDTPIVELWNKIDRCDDPERVQLEALTQPVDVEGEDVAEEEVEMMNEYVKSLQGVVTIDEVPSEEGDHDSSPSSDIDQLLSSDTIGQKDKDSNQQSFADNADNNDEGYLQFDVDSLKEDIDSSTQSNSVKSKTRSNDMTSLPYTNTAQSSTKNTGLDPKESQAKQLSSLIKFTRYRKNMFVVASSVKTGNSPVHFILV